MPFDSKEKRKKYNRKYYLEHQEKIRKRHREWTGKWKKEHPRECRAYQKGYDAGKRYRRRNE